jgi:hypothetical protein
MACLRKNNSNSVSCDPNNIVGFGTFKKVHLARYNDGFRVGSLAVIKHFKNPSSLEDSYYQNQPFIVEVASKLIDGFNQLRIIDQPVSLSEPQVWVDSESMETSLVEPFIENFEKFNSNTGWVNPDRKAWNSAMQALSHFSYHITQGKAPGAFIFSSIGNLLPFQDSYYYATFKEALRRVAWFSPIRLSCRCEAPKSCTRICILHSTQFHRKQGFGATDLGCKGIETFFCHHVCTEFCCSHWALPDACSTKSFPRKHNTTMMLSLHATPSMKNAEDTLKVYSSDWEEERESEESRRSRSKSGASSCHSLFTFPAALEETLLSIH